MEWLNEAQIDATFTVPASLIFPSNILASGDGDAAWQQFVRELDWNDINQYQSRDWGMPNQFGSPKVFGPARLPAPSILLIGNSHMKMYGHVLRKLADEYETQIGFAVQDGDWMFQIPFAQLGQRWRPRITMLADYYNGYAHYNDEALWPTLFKTVLAFSETFIILGDVPDVNLCQTRISCGGSMLKNEVYQQGMADGNFAFLTQVIEQPMYAARRRKQEAAIRATALLPEFLGRVNFIPLASYFLTNTEPPYVRLVDHITGGLVYMDPNHLNPDGARRVEQVFRKELFGQPIC